jgi:hypothetical protein
MDQKLDSPTDSNRADVSANPYRTAGSWIVGDRRRSFAAPIATNSRMLKRQPIPRGVGGGPDDAVPLIDGG